MFNASVPPAASSPALELLTLLANPAKAAELVGAYETAKASAEAAMVKAQGEMALVLKKLDELKALSLELTKRENEIAAGRLEDSRRRDAAALEIEATRRELQDARRNVAEEESALRERSAKATTDLAAWERRLHGQEQALSETLAGLAERERLTAENYKASVALKTKLEIKLTKYRQLGEE